MKKNIILFVILIICQHNVWAIDPSFQSDNKPDVDDITVKTIGDLIDLSYQASFKDINKAVQYCEIALKKAQYNNRPKDLFEVNRGFGLVYENNNILDRALEYYTKALELTEKTDDNDRVTILVDIAIIYKKMGDYKKSRDHYLQVLDVATAIKDEEMQEAAYDGLGSIYESVGDFGNALKHYFLSLGVAEGHENRWGQIVSYQNIAMVYRKSRNYSLALDAIMKSDKLAKLENDTLQIANVHNDLGEILADQGKFEAAAAKHKAALELFKTVGFKTKIVKSFLNNATVAMSQKHYKEAEAFLLQCFEYKENFWNYDHANAYYNLGELYLLTSRPNEAEKALKQGLTVSEQFEFKDLSQKFTYKLYELNKQRGNFAVAFAFLDRSNILRDSLFSEAQNKKVAESQFLYDVAKRNEEIQKLKETNTRNALIAISSVFSILLFSLLYIVFIRGKNNKVLVNKNVEIQLQNKRLEESNEILRQFAYAAAHDLKEPLRNIGSFVNLIQRRSGAQLSEESNEYMGFVLKGVKRMNNLLTDLLQYSTVITQNPTDELLNPKEIIGEVSESLQSTIQRKHATIRCDDKMPGVYMNRLHLTQLMQNLISNSLKFVEKDPLVCISAQEKDGRTILKVSDNGIGIKQEYAEKVFNLFHQLHKHTGRYEGTGIGLTICKNIVEKYNGHIWFESEGDNGTSFFISLPQHAPLAS